MSITNADRYHLQKRANQVLGEAEGTTLMELLPPVGWAEVATKSDLSSQTVVLRSEFRADLERGLRKLESKMFAQFLTVLGLFATMAGLLVAVLLRT
ncbi:MAG: hypothetical protein KDB24_13335 [Microthrixaceae bacterium]|nr:hypothetical protein [Microthrixaceae bacterium]